MLPQPGKAASGVRHVSRGEQISRQMEVAIDPDRSVGNELYKGTGLMHEPQFAGRCLWSIGLVGPRAPDDNSVLNVAFLGEDENLIARRWWA